MGVFKLFREGKDENIPKKYVEAIRQLLNGDCVDVWCAFMVCINQTRNELEHRSPFVIMSQEMITDVATALDKNREALKTCQQWQGNGRPGGLW